MTWALRLGRHLVVQRGVALKDLLGGRSLGMHVGNQVHRNLRPFGRGCALHDFRIAGREGGTLIQSLANARRTTAGAFAMTVR